MDEFPSFDNQGCIKMNLDCLESMAAFKDPEITNANQWETDSMVSVVTSALSQSLLRTQQQWGSCSHRSSGSSYQESPYPDPLEIGRSLRHPIPSTPYQANSPTTSPTRPQAVVHPTHKHWIRYSTSRGRQIKRGTVSKGVRINWAKPDGLVTTRKANLGNEKVAKEAKMARLRSKPVRDDEFVATGYYLWPNGSDPMTLFDANLSAFDILRNTYEVHIDWNEKMHCLRLNCTAGLQVAEENIADAINGIKLRYLDAQAQIVSASPFYVIVPPTTAAIRPIVQPEKVVEHTGSTNALIKSFKLTGQRLSPDAQLEWEAKRQQMSDENSKAFRSHLFRRVFELKDLRSWMRMRVQFGHVILSQYQNNFLHGKYSFDMFADMMKKSRVVSGGTFDRKMDASIAKDVVQRIVDRHQDFSPRNSKIPFLKDVIHSPTHTEVIFLRTPDNQNLRLEAEIESVQYGALGKYQIGHTRLFMDDGRNKRAEVTTIDIESKLDWTLEIIQDSEQNSVPEVLRNFIVASLDSRSSELLDPLELPYPAISLSAPIGFSVKSVVMRSVSQYQRISSSNVIEIAIYREWAGINTNPAPKMSASISMFNPDWDTEMRSIENTTSERQWDRDLHNFFGKEEPNTCSGLTELLVDIHEVQRLLCQAAMAVTVMDKHQQEEYDKLDVCIRKEEEAEKEDAIARQTREVRRIVEADEERGQQQIPMEEVVERETTNEAAMVYIPLPMGPSFLASFDDTPTLDGSLI